ncbi:restriction endonuclease subunit S [uncultured Psychrobacter sp.]|uniref:restriction endonuclease subunit S n=1 Tax=uncultured Psychrobacter sp. TaxID=259303 RepID=UPI0034575F5E
MAKYQQYEEYRNSGVEWLDVIPSHWVMTKIKYIAPFQVGWTPPTGNDANFIGENIWANISDLRGKVINDTVKRISDKAAKEASMDITPKGSLLYSFKLSVGSVSFAGCDMYTNEAIASFTSDSSLPLEYLYYVLPKFLIENASTNIYGARILNQELIRNAIILKPTYEEAETIGKFLDHETAQIDTLIEKQQTLIQLLKEKRQAVISHAVTKGLNPDVPMKDSGVEWLGEVPEHWEVKPLKYLIRAVKGAVKAGPFGSHLKNSDMQGEDIKVITQKNVITQDINIGDSFISSKKYQELQTFKIFKKDLLITTRGTIGRTLVYDKDDTAILHPCLIRIQLDESKANTHLMSLIIQESGYALEQILVNSNATTIEVIYSDNLINTIVAIPESLEEQVQILNFIESKKFEFDKLISRAKNAIQLMKERRTALISAAVTGKIDVRGWRAPE